MTISRQAVNVPILSSNNIGSFPSGTQGRLILNGQVFFIASGYASGLSITTLGNSIANASFTIVGTYNGTIITEVIAGPSTIANASYTNNLFHTIISIDISIPATSGFTIGSNYNVAVVLQDNANRISEFKPNYSVLFNSISASGPWAAGGAIIYGVANTVPTSLQVTNLTYASRPSNYFSLQTTGIGLASFTNVQLINGVNIQTTYPYAALIVYLAKGVNTSPVFIEVSQS